MKIILIERLVTPAVCSILWKVPVVHLHMHDNDHYSMAVVLLKTKLHQKQEWQPAKESMFLPVSVFLVGVFGQQDYIKPTEHISMNAA